MYSSLLTKKLKAGQTSAIFVMHSKLCSALVFFSLVLMITSLFSGSLQNKLMHLCNKFQTDNNTKLASIGQLHDGKILVLATTGQYYIIEKDKFNLHYIQPPVGHVMRPPQNSMVAWS